MTFPLNPNIEELTTELQQAQAEIIRLTHENETLREAAAALTAVAEQSRTQGEHFEKLARQQRRLLRDVLAAMTEGRFQFCELEDLPARCGEAVYSVPLRSDTLRDLRRAVRDSAAELGFDSVRRHDIELATGEAAMNAVIHAGGGQGTVFRDAPTHRMQVWIEDQGKGIDVGNLPRPPVVPGEYRTASGHGGHGLWMVLRTVDRLWIATSPEGTTAVLEQGDETVKEPAWLTALRG